MSAEEAGSGKVEKRVHEPKPGNGAAINKVYKGTSQAVRRSILAER